MVDFQIPTVPNLHLRDFKTPTFWGKKHVWATKKPSYFPLQYIIYIIPYIYTLNNGWVFFIAHLGRHSRSLTSPLKSYRAPFKGKDRLPVASTFSGEVGKNFRDNYLLSTVPWSSLTLGRVTCSLWCTAQTFCQIIEPLNLGKSESDVWSQKVQYSWWLKSGKLTSWGW